MSIPYFNAKTKVYPDGATSTIVFNSPTFRSPDWSLAQSLKFAPYISDDNDLKNRHLKKICSQSSVISQCLKIDTCIMTDEFVLKAKRSFFPTRKKGTNTTPRSDSLKRAKDRIFDYVLCNDFDYFFTGTIDPAKYNSKDPKSLFTPVQNWLKNRVKLDGYRYIMIAEHHKDGKIHFHGLISGDNLQLFDSGTKSYTGFKEKMFDYTAIRKGLNPANGHIVYNLLSWKFGFTTCIKLYGDRMNTAYYITKYITKDCKKIFGKFFWHSRGLKKPDIRYENIDYDSVEAKEYFNKHMGRFKYVFRRKEENERIQAEKKKSANERHILRTIKQLFHDVVNDLVINRDTGEVLDFVTLLE